MISFQSEYYGDSGDPGGCIDINECQERIANCHEHAICLNEIGSFSCHCNSGYSGDGTHCECKYSKTVIHIISFIL